MPTLILPKTILFLSLLSLSGCSALETAPRLSQLGRIDDFQLPLTLTPSVDSLAFADCMAPATAKVKLGFGHLVGKLRDQAENGVLLNQLGLLEKPNLAEHALQTGTHLRDLIDHFTTNLTISDRVGIPGSGIGEKIHQKAEKIAEYIQQHPLDSEQDLQLLKKLSRAYLKAYFIKPVDFNRLQSDDEKNLRAEIASILKRNPNDPKVNALLETLQPKLKPATLKIAGFIDRDGSQFGFSGISTSADSLKVDHSQIGADVMRIFLDALRDTLVPLPVLAYSTAGEQQAEFDVMTFQTADQPISFDWHTDRHDHSKTIHLSITAQQFEYIQALAKQAEASAASSVGKAIRGGAVGSLNNEAIARQLETAAGVLARHAAERSQWCLLAQGQL
ncbi:hypothetical protein [Methylomonas methanica]|uniref:Lipoprotein n=1 Tax=Methylomonas methanica (strain DSM 25384 / MC09) TaxID=857087 RepID=G0A6S8_METMM|nr:hypothetical protein [Methylomonas methanica]AEG00549.1 hypothetical protein Metme_2144 [Methylomonas methanica MC09]